MKGMILKEWANRELVCVYRCMHRIKKSSHDIMQERKKLSEIESAATKCSLLLFCISCLYLAEKLLRRIASNPLRGCLGLFWEKKKLLQQIAKYRSNDKAPPPPTHPPSSTLYIQIAVKIKLPILNKDIPGTKTQIYERTKRPTGTDRESMK